MQRLRSPASFKCPDGPTGGFRDTKHENGSSSYSGETSLFLTPDELRAVDHIVLIITSCDWMNLLIAFLDGER